MKRVYWVGVVLLLGVAIGCGGSDVPKAGQSGDGAGPHQAGAGAAKASASQPVGPAEERQYRVTIHSTCTAEMPDGEKNLIDSDAAFQYTWRFRGREAELLLHQIEDRTRLNGQPMVESSRSRERFHARRGEQVVVDATFDTADEQLREVLRDSFDCPLCKVALDQQGREVARSITAGPGAQMVLDDGIIANARLFHGPFAPGKKRWESPAEISMGQGRFARGTLRYELLGKPAGDVAPPGRVAVKVSGELTGGGDVGEGRRDSVTYRLAGTQVYDKDLGRWRSGRFDVAMSSQIAAGEQKIAATGTTKIQMELLPEETPEVQTAARPSTSLK